MITEDRKRDLHRRFRQQPMPEIQTQLGARFYVTAVSGSQRSAVLGPYASHMTALVNVERGRKLAEEKFPADAAFASFGTASLPRTIRTKFGR